MAYSKEIRDRVRTSYVREGLPLHQVAQAHNVPYNTVRTWRRTAKAKGDDWDQARSAHRLIQGGSPEITAAFMDDFVHIYHANVRHLREIMQDENNYNPIEVAEGLSKMADAWTKTMSALTRGRPSLNKLTVALEVLQEFNSWIRENNPEIAKDWVDLIEPFSAHLTKVIGK